METDIQTETDKWYNDLFGSTDRKEQIETAFKKGGELASELQDEVYGFTHWATFWQLEEKEYYIELGNKPEVRLQVMTDLRGVVTNANFQFQDELEPWTVATNQDTELLMTYAKIVGLYDE